MLKTLSLITALLMGTTATAQNTGNWSTSVARDQMTDFENYTAIIRSSNDVRHQYPHQRITGKAQLIIRCHDNSTAIYIKMDGKFLSDHQFGRVTARVDQNTAQTYNMRESTDNEALGLWRGNGINLIKSLEDARTVRFEVTPYNESSQVMVFDINGINDVIAETRTRCSW